MRSPVCSAAGREATWNTVPGFWSTIGTNTIKHAAWGDGYEKVRLVDHGDGAFTAWYADAHGTCVGVLTHDRDPDYETGQRLIARGGLSAVSRLRAIVVIPARDEAEHVERCLRALAAQRGLRPAVTFETILVLDRCTDEDRGGRTRRRTRPRASTLHVEHSPGAGSAPPAATGWTSPAAGCRVSEPDGLIACTDADSVVAPDWLAAQLALVDAGADAIWRPHRARPPPAPPRCRPPRCCVASSARGSGSSAVLADDPSAEHHFFSGASLGVTARAYRAVGGIDPVTALEDEGFGLAADRWRLAHRPLRRGQRAHLGAHPTAGRHADWRATSSSATGSRAAATTAARAAPGGCWRPRAIPPSRSSCRPAIAPRPSAACCARR